jgi:ArsR family transcriptional regulator
MPPQPPIDRMFKAFADETRLRVLHLLTRGELCVCDIMDALRLPQSKVSRHLAYLRDSGLVQVRRDGLWKHYSLAPAASKFQKGILGCLSGCFEEVDVLRRDMKNLKNQKKKKKSC